MERRKKRIVKLTAFLFLLAASIFVMPQKAFADENEDVTLPTGSAERSMNCIRFWRIV